MSEEDKKVLPPDTVDIAGLKELPYEVEEALNRLRINISSFGKRYKKIMVISSIPNEGKSFVTLQLWRMFAEAGIKSLFIDADMRNSVVIYDYDIHPSKELVGLSDYLSGKAEIKDILKHTGLEYGDMILNPKNVVNPSLLFEGDLMEKLLKEVEDDYEYIFLDTPPLDIVSDGEKIAKMCDGTLLVIGANSTSRNVAKNTIKQLERTGCPLLGVTLNRAFRNGGGYYSGGYYSSKYYGKKHYGDYYSKYYGNHSEKEKK